MTIGIFKIWELISAIQETKSAEISGNVILSLIFKVDIWHISNPYFRTCKADPSFTLLHLLSALLSFITQVNP